MKLKEVMELGGRHLLGWLNPDRDYRLSLSKIPSSVLYKDLWILSKDQL